MIRPHSLDSETIARLRHLVVATYSGRDDLYAAAAQVTDKDLGDICCKLADDLAGNAAYLEQIIIMHDEDPGYVNAIASSLGEKIMKLVRARRGDQGIVSAVQQKQMKLREKYEATIDAMHDSEAHSLLETQKKAVEFAEHVLRKVSPCLRQELPADKPENMP
jgi:hypothetical protein